MRYFTTCFLFLMALHTLCADPIPAQNKKYQADSLRLLIARTRQDTEKIRLTCELGLAAPIDRRAFWDSILHEARKYNLPACECKAWLGMGEMYYRQSNRASAISCYEKGIAFAEEKNCKAEAMRLISCMVSRYVSVLDQKKFLELDYKGLRLAQELGDKYAEIDFYSSIAMSYFFSKDLDKALAMHFNCLKVSRHLNYHFGIANALSDIGSDYYNMHKPEECKKYYLASAAYAHEFEGTWFGAYLYNSASAAYEIVGQGDSTCKYAIISLGISRKIGNKIGEASSLVCLAKGFYLLHDIARAEKTAREALAMAQSLRFTTQIPDLALFLKKVYSEEKKYKEALEAYELSITMRDSISDEKARKRVREKEFTYNYEKKENENRLLAQKNQIQQLQLSQGKYLMTGLVVLLVFILIIAWLFIRQNRINTAQKNVQLEQKLLRAQMNPHFIFNSLTAIQQFIMRGENAPAELYLLKFSKLMRELLESNLKENITIKEEVEILTGYIEMESLRFGRSFSYSLTVDEKINADRINIPHMMIQPFVENAIWHGLLAKAGDRELKVSFESRNSRSVSCIVDDNGIGREASMNKKESTFKKQSLALSLVRQRLQLMGKALGIDCGVEVIDKKDEKGNSTGTRILINLPMLG